MAQRRRNLELALPRILADEALQLSPRLRQLLAELREEWRELDGRIEALTRRSRRPPRPIRPAAPAAHSRVGPMIASALVRHRRRQRLQAWA